MRIVSLLPSATEMLSELGLLDRLVAVSHDCDYPPAVSRLPRITATLIPPDAGSREIDGAVRDALHAGRPLYQLDAQRLKALRPDLVVTQSLCPVCAVGESEVRDVACFLPDSARIVSLRATTLEGVFEDFLAVGRAAGRGPEAERRLHQLRSRVERVAERSGRLAARPRVALLEWADPPFACGHWTPELVRLAGGTEGLGQAGRPSRTVAWNEVLAWQPEVLVLACCGFDEARARPELEILRQRPGFADLPCSRHGRVWVLDGSRYFNRPGPRLVEALELLAHLLHPAVHPAPPGVPVPDPAVPLPTSPS